MKKNIWIINHYAKVPEHGGKARHFNFAKKLYEEGYDVTIIYSSAVHNSNINDITDSTPYKISFKEGIRCISIRTSNYMGNNLKRILNILQFYIRLKKYSFDIAGNQSPDVIIGSSMHPLTLYASAKISKKFNRKLIMEIRDLWPETLHSLKPNINKPFLNLLYGLERNLYLKADSLIFTMKGGYDYLVERGWGNIFKKENVYYIDNGVDLETYYYNQQNYQIDDTDLANENLFKVVYTGTIGRVNNIKMLVDTAELLQENNNTKIKLLIWGSGPELKHLSKLVEEKSLTNIVFKGIVGKEYIPYILSKSNLNLIHNRELAIHRFGTSQNKKYEYLAAGKPIISTGKSGNDIIKENNAGITLKEPTPECLYEAILSIYNMNTQTYDEMSSKVKSLAQQYDFKVLTKTLIEAIENA